MKKFKLLIIAILSFAIVLFNSGTSFAQTGDNCATAIPVTGSTTITNSGINTSSGSTIGGAGFNSLWYIFAVPTSGTMDVNSCLGGEDTELSIHDLGTSGSCALAAATPSENNDDSCPFAADGSGFTYASEITGFAVTGGNTYAIEWSDRWSSAPFTWNLVYDPLTIVLGCTDNCDSNYDPIANTNDPTACAGDNLCGCTDPLALNYDPTATIDDGSCGFLGDNCFTAVALPSDCDATITNPGIATNGTSVGTNGSNSYWYTYIAPATGLLQITSCGSGIDTEVAVHDLGATADCNLLGSIGYSDDGCPADGSSDLTVAVTAGNTYAIEWGDRWNNVGFDWNLTFGCEPIIVATVFANTVAAQIDFVDTLSDGSSVLATIEYGLTGFTQGNGTTVTGLPNPIILTSLNSAATYDYCVTYNCNTSSCNAIQTCGSFTTEPSCLVPEFDLSANCLVAGFFTINLEVTNAFSFGGGIIPGNPSGFNILLDNGSGFADTGIDATSTASVNIPGPFASGTAVTIKLEGIDDIGCPSAIISIDENCDEGSGCNVFPIMLSGCTDIITTNGIQSNGNAIATDGGDAKWYFITAPADGILQVSSSIDPNLTNTEVAIHDLGPTGDCALAANPATAEDDDSGDGSTSLVNLSVIGGNVYAIEWGDQWSADTFSWTFNFGCESIANVVFEGATESAVQIGFTDTLSDGTSVAANIEYGITGFTPGSGTMLTGLATPIIITGLMGGTTYEYCLTYPCSSGCDSNPICGTVITDVSCTVPIYNLTATCVSTGFYSIEIDVTNVSAFTPSLLAANPSGFDILIDTGNGFVDSNSDAIAVNTAAIVGGPFISGSAVSVQLSGIDNVGCPSAIQSVDIDCVCFGTEPANDFCLNATSLTVDTIPTCDGITAPFTLACASVDASDPIGSCFNGDNNANVWFSFVAPLNGQVTVSTDYAGGILTDTEIALYSGTCGALTEIGCDQDGGNTVNFNSIITNTTLIGGDTYFIQVDRWGTAPDESFCIDVIDINPAVVVTCIPSLNITGLVATGLYEADDVITSNGQINAASGGPVIYNAGANAGGAEYIELTIGFDADGTTDFTAENIECDTTD